MKLKISWLETSYDLLSMVFLSLENQDLKNCVHIYSSSNYCQWSINIAFLMVFINLQVWFKTYFGAVITIRSGTDNKFT